MGSVKVDTRVKAAGTEEGRGTVMDEDDLSPCGSLRGDAQRIWTWSRECGPSGVNRTPLDPKELQFRWEDRLRTIEESRARGWPRVSSEGRALGSSSDLIV